jgi:anhydro-N-acetylmuramic acid kinase
MHQPTLFQKHSPLGVIGLMSGTSLDGIDASAMVLQHTAEGLQWQLVGTHSSGYTPALRQQLLAIQQPQAKVALATLTELHRDVALAFAQTAKPLLQQCQQQGVVIHALASHGQTVFHGPPTAKQPVGCTLQLGELAYLTHATGMLTVGNFRPGDMAAGGHGAPLVPFAEQCLFLGALQQGKRLLLQNIGGIANVTLLGQGLLPQAFDTGPGNMLMDVACQHWTGKPYDKHGALARAGKVDEGMLQHLLSDPYLKAPPPKSTGRDYFGVGYWQSLLTRFGPRTPEDWQATLTAFTAHSIVDAYRRWVFDRTMVDAVIVGGGGTQNPVLMETLTQLLAPLPVQPHEAWGIPSQYKESMAFAVLGWATLTRQHNTLPSCTGARHPVVMGQVCWP